MLAKRGGKDDGRRMTDEGVEGRGSQGEKDFYFSPMME